MDSASETKTLSAEEEARKAPNGGNVPLRRSQYQEAGEDSGDYHRRLDLSDEEDATTKPAMPPSSSMIHFQNPKRYDVASFRAEAALEQATRVARHTNAHRGRHHHLRAGPARKSLPAAAGVSLPVDITPAFLRRAARGLAPTEECPDLVGVRSAFGPDSSFCGADASALDGTFVSIRDLDDDDDVPSVDNACWQHETEGGREEGRDRGSDFATETSSLLGSVRDLPWRGGFFGSEIEREDRRERRRMLRSRWGWARGWLTARSWLRAAGGEERRRVHDGSGGAAEADYPAEAGLASPTHHSGRSHQVVGGAFTSHRCTFSLFVRCALGFHMALCGLHDLFLCYLAYRNPFSSEVVDAVGVSLNGEGPYLPPNWLSFDGRVANSWLGPGARTLTAFGVLVPGLALVQGQAWRAVTATLQTSSAVQLALHTCALRSAAVGFERRRGPLAAATLYLISALVGEGWSAATEPGRLVTAAGMGVTGLLAATVVEETLHPWSSKEGDDRVRLRDSPRNARVSGGGLALSSSCQKWLLFYGSSPALLLILETLASWQAAYTSLVGTVAAAVAGAACTLLLFVKRLPPGPFDSHACGDLLFAEDPPPPPPLSHWKGDDDSADDSADTSIESSKHFFNTPLMRRSILADEDEEEMRLGTSKGSLRNRRKNGTSVSPARTPGKRRQSPNSIEKTQIFSAPCVIAGVVGALLMLLLTLIPVSLIATGAGPSNATTRAAVLGCRPLRIIYPQDDGDGARFECAGGCIPLSRERLARKDEGMYDGRCATIGYRCWWQSGTMTLRNYKANIGIYGMPSADGSCGDDDVNGSGSNSNANTDDGMVEGDHQYGTSE